MRTHPRQSPTIFDLAHRAGLSKSTISAALLDNHRISAKTRERVRNLAAEMGYTRNAFAATLATYGQTKLVRSLDVAIISHVPAGAGYEAYDSSVIKGRLRELGYEGHHYDIFHDRIPCRKLARRLYHEGYCGVIFDQIYEQQSEVFSVDWKALCLVCAGRTYRRPPCDNVRGNTWQTVSVAFMEIQKAGYRRPGFALCSHQPVILDDLERRGALSICQQGLPRREKAIPPYLGAIADRASLERWYRRHRPDVVVGFNSLHYSRLSEMGLRIPQDVAYANLHDDMNGGIAGVVHTNIEIKIKAAEHLDFLVRHRRTGYSERPWELLAPVHWVPGESLPVLRGSVL